MAVRVYNNMERRGVLGKDEFRFSVRMFMSLQLATNELKLYISTPTMRFLSDNVDEFAAYRLPKRVAALSSTPRSAAKAKSVRRVFSGCWLCPATDHQAWDTRHHPRAENGARKPVSKEDKLSG